MGTTVSLVFNDAKPKLWTDPEQRATAMHIITDNFDLEIQGTLQVHVITRVHRFVRILRDRVLTNPNYTGSIRH